VSAAASGGPRWVLDLDDVRLRPPVVRQDGAAQLRELVGSAGRLAQDGFSDGIPAVDSKRRRGSGDLHERIVVEQRGRDQPRRRVVPRQSSFRRTGREELARRVRLRRRERVALRLGLRAKLPHAAPRIGLHGPFGMKSLGCSRPWRAKVRQLRGKLFAGEVERFDRFRPGATRVTPRSPTDSRRAQSAGAARGKEGQRHVTPQSRLGLEVRAVPRGTRPGPLERPRCPIVILDPRPLTPPRFRPRIPGAGLERARPEGTP
jgi:hypothetical protein